MLAASGLPFPAIELRYRPSPANGLEGAEVIADALDRVADRERRRQMPLLGPHRDELEILWGGHEIRRVASAGERKALSLMLLAAHGQVMEEAGRPPLYLLDDMDAELAPPTVAAVWGVFRGAAQLFATSNRPQVWLTLDVGTHLGDGARASSPARATFRNALRESSTLLFLLKDARELVAPFSRPSPEPEIRA